MSGDDRLEGLAARLQSIQQMEQEKKDTIGKFMMALAERSNDDQTAKIQSVMEDLRRVELEGRACREENTKLAKQLEEATQRMHDVQSKQVEELTLIQKRNADSESRSHAVISEQENQLQMYKSELMQKNQALRKLEDECSRLRIDGSQHESKIEAMGSEMTELHGAMASLHGELSVLQRELDDAQREAKRATDSLCTLQKTAADNLQELEGLRREKAENDGDFAKLEQRLADTTAKLNSMSYETTSRIEGLAAERESLQSALLKKEVKLKQQVTTNQELNSHLGKLHADVMGIKEEYVKLEEESAKRVDYLTEELSKLRDSLNSSEGLNERLSRQMTESKEETTKLLEELGVQKSQVDSMTADARRLVKRVERVEMEKADLLIELSNQATVRKELQNSLDAVQEKYTLATERVEKEKHQYRELETNFRSKEGEVRQLHNQLADREERTVALERHLNEEVKLKEHAIEANRAQQKESANRIVELSQKNSKLAGDLSSAQEELSVLKNKFEETSSYLRTCELDCDELKGKNSVINKRVQELEDTVEMDLARLDASEAEIDELKQAARVASEKASAAKEELMTAHKHELQALKVSQQGVVEDMEAAAAAMKKHSESHLEKSLAKARESFQRQLEEIQAARHRESSDARNRLSTLGTAMEGLQKELRDESGKSSQLKEEIAVLRDLVENGGGEAEERLKHVEKERAKERHRLESALADTKDQVNSANEAIAQLRHQVAALKGDLSAERELNASNQQALKVAKDRVRNIEGSSDSVSNELNSLKKQLKDNERRFNAQLTTKDEEIQRVTRRNEVLSEAVSRLTQMNSAGGTPSGTHGEQGYGFSTRGGGYVMSYDQHQQTMEHRALEYCNLTHDSYEPQSSNQPAPSTPASRRGLDDESSVFNPPNISAPPPEPSNRFQGGSVLRSSSATVRTPTKKDNSAGRASSANGVKSSYPYSNQQLASSLSPRGSQSPRAAPSSPLGRPVDDVSSSLLRVQRALESRRSNSTPRGGIRSGASNGTSSSSITTKSPHESLGGGDGRNGIRDRQSPASKSNSTNFTCSETNRPIKAEYDAAYAQSAQSVLQNEIFSPSRRREVVSNPSSPAGGSHHAPPDIEFDYGPSVAELTAPPSSTRSRVPQLDISKDAPKAKTSAHEEGNETFDVDSGRGGVSNRSAESSSSRDSTGSYSRRIRVAVELGKDSQLPFSPSRNDKATGGSQTERVNSGVLRQQRADGAKRAYSAPPEKVNLSRVIKASRDKASKK